MKNTIAFNLSKTSIQEVIKAAEKSDLPVVGKFEDSTILFSFNHESEFIYARDLDAPNHDMFGNCHIAFEFADVLRQNLLSLDFVKKYFEPIFDSLYEFSNVNETGSASLQEVLS